MSKYTFRPARFQHDYLKGYWVRLYLIYDGSHTYTLYNESDWLDNAVLMMETSMVYTFTKEILVTPVNFSHIYDEIVQSCV